MSANGVQQHFMQDHYRPSSGDHVYTFFDNRTGYEGYPYNRTESYPAVSSLDRLASVYSDQTKPYPRFKPHDYAKETTSYAQGSRSAVDTFDENIGGVSVKKTYGLIERGILGGAPTVSISGDKNTAYNTALSQVSEVVRGQIDLTIDGFQASQTVKLAKRILGARKSVEKIVMRMLSDAGAATRKPNIRLKKIGSKRYYRQQRGIVQRKKRTADEHFNNIFRRPMKEVGGLWLEFTYGLKPTLQTIYDLIDQQNVRCGNSLHITRKGKPCRGSQKLVVKEQYNKRPLRGWTETASTTTHWATEIGGTYQPGTSFVESASRIVSLNPASIAWELLPFSFVVDWFLNIGGYLRNMETALLSNMLGKFSGYVTNMRITTTSSQWTGNGLIDGTMYGGSSSAKRKIVMKKRTVLTTFPLPRPPTFRSDLSSGRMLNAAALLTIFLK